ncbi:MAG: DUF4251 domain-containing protein [Bacteroides sp.]|nr:DUF4251 domain-containing protein [Bacteroides sp.]
MKRLALLILVLLTFVAGQAQTTEKRIYTQAEQKAAQEREEQKKMEEIQDSIHYVEAVNSLEKLDFVVEADKLIFKHGETAYVTSNTNFISLSDDQAVVQIAPFNNGGPNGVGGITLEGKASNIKMQTDKKGNITFSMNVMGTGISASISISLLKGSHRATVTVNPNFSSNRITLSGYLIPKAYSTVFQGTSF